MYHVVKTIKGRKYHYKQESKRVGKKVRTKSYYVGPVGASFSVLKAGLVLAADQSARKRALTPIETKMQRVATSEKFRKEANDRPVEINGLATRRDWTAEKEFNHESGLTPYGK